MKNKLIGRTVKVRKNKKYPDPYEGEKGTVVYVVRNGRAKDYIVQFPNDWSYYRGKQLKVVE